MAPLVVLLTVTAVARVVGALGVSYVSAWSNAAAVGLAAMFILTGIAHFAPRRRAGLVAIVPPFLSHPDVLVTATGICELFGAVTLLTANEAGPTRSFAAWGLVALLIVMFPANVYASQSQRHESAPHHTPLLQRTVMQIVFVMAAVFVALTS